MTKGGRGEVQERQYLLGYKNCLWLNDIAKILFYPIAMFPHMVLVKLSFGHPHNFFLFLFLFFFFSVLIEYFWVKGNGSEVSSPFRKVNEFYKK